MASKATKQIRGFSKEEIDALRRALRQEKEHSRRLKQENQQLKSALRKLRAKHKTLIKQQHQGQKVKTKTQEAKKYKSMEAADKTAKVKEREQRKADKAAWEIQREQIQAHLEGKSRQEKHMYWFDILYGPQFINRLEDYFGTSWNKAWSVDIMNKLRLLTSKEFNSVIRSFNLESMMYDSDGTYSIDNLEIDEEFQEAESMYNNILGEIDALIEARE